MYRLFGEVLGEKKTFHLPLSLDSPIPVSPVGSKEEIYSLISSGREKIIKDYYSINSEENIPYKFYKER